MIVIVETPDDAAYTFSPSRRRAYLDGAELARATRPVRLSAQRAHGVLAQGQLCRSGQAVSHAM